MPHALIVHAHPEAHSFCAAQMREAVSTLETQGYTVEVSDLYQMNWSPALGRDDFTHPLEGHFKPGPEQVRAYQQGTFAPDVAAELEKLLRADLLVFSFPMWWFSLPAILKGWVDRVFSMGVAFDGRGVWRWSRHLREGRVPRTAGNAAFHHWKPGGALRSTGA